MADFEAFAFEERVKRIGSEFFSGEGNVGKFIFAGVAGVALEALAGPGRVFVRDKAPEGGVVPITVDVLKGKERLFVIEAESELGGVSFFFGKASMFEPFGVPHFFEVLCGKLILHAFSGLVAVRATLGDDRFSPDNIAGGGF